MEKRLSRFFIPSQVSIMGAQPWELRSADIVCAFMSVCDAQVRPQPSSHLDIEKHLRYP